MDDQVLMRVEDRGAYLSEQIQPLLERETMRAAVSVDRLAVHVPHHEERAVPPPSCRVEQAGDVRVFEGGEDLALVAEALEDRVAVHPALD